MRTPQGEDPSPVILATAEGAAETSEVRSDVAVKNLENPMVFTSWLEKPMEIS